MVMKYVAVCVTIAFLYVCLLRFFYYFILPYFYWEIIYLSCAIKPAGISVSSKPMPRIATMNDAVATLCPIDNMYRGNSMAVALCATEVINDGR